MLKKVITELFSRYSNGKVMSPENLAEFTSKCTQFKCQINDQKVVDTFSRYDLDNDGFLVESDFIAFYTDACKNRLDVVWKNLHTFGYRNDLRKPDEVEVPKIDETLLPRYILANHNEFFTFMFILLSEVGAGALLYGGPIGR